MERIQFEIGIHAPVEKVWDILWGSDTYPKWTRVFSEDSRAITDWQEGSKVHFLNGKGDGMYSEIEMRIENELMSIHHLGAVKDGVEQPDSEETQKWGDAYEIYNLEPDDDGTILTVDLDTVEEFKGYFNETFPKALNIIKELSEAP